MAIPGKKLNFMGNEIGVEEEWSDHLASSKGILNADSAKKKRRRQIFKLVAALNKLYVEKEALYKKDNNSLDIVWLEKNDPNGSLVAYKRKNPKGPAITCLHNFAGNKPMEYTVPIDSNKFANPKEIFNSDSKEYGGQGRLNTNIQTTKVSTKFEHDKPVSYKVVVPPMSTVMIEESCT